jgi:hypothetical protein
MTTAIISGSVALIIFAATQLFLHLRERQMLLRAKLEDLFSAMNGVSNSFIDLQHAIHDKDEEAIGKAFRGVNESFYKPRSLILLYFPYIADIWEESILSQAHELKSNLNEIENLDKLNLTACDETINKAAIYIRYLQNFLARNQELSTETLTFHFNRICRRRLRIKMPKLIYEKLKSDGMIKGGKIGSTKIEVKQVGIDQLAIYFKL